MTTTKLLERAIRNVTTPVGREVLAGIAEDHGFRNDWLTWSGAMLAIRAEYARLRAIKRGKRGTA